MKAKTRSGRRASHAASRIGVHGDVCHLVIVQARALHLGVGHGEAERLDQMELDPGVRRDPDGVAGVRRNAGLVEDDLEVERLGLGHPAIISQRVAIQSSGVRLASAYS